MLVLFSALPVLAQTGDTGDIFAEQAPLSQQDMDNFVKIYEDLVMSINNRQNYLPLFDSVGWEIDRGAFVMAKISYGRIMLDSTLADPEALRQVSHSFKPSETELELIKENVYRLEEIDVKHGWDKLQ